MVTLVKQYRYPFHQVILRAARRQAGHREAPPLAPAGAKEEVGMTPDELIYLGALYLARLLREIIHLYLAKGPPTGACQPDEDEFLELVRVPFDELVEQVMKCGVADGRPWPRC